MIDPILRIRLTIQRRLLNINSAIGWIEPNSPDTSRLASNRTSEIDFLEERRGDEIDVLAWEFHTYSQLSSLPFFEVQKGFLPGFGKSPIMEKATKLPIAPESSLPGRPSFVGWKYSGM